MFHATLPSRTSSVTETKTQGVKGLSPPVDWPDAGGIFPVHLPAGDIKREITFMEGARHDDM